ncbi:hypothetical protein [Streptomyces sp. ScaeMP-e10]|uniref:hypothetical protein n=1 Tax=Streptomyces sp. ScaeMP-e10 TaxID=1156841 RepID=UPI001F2DB53C|nr:hypothetical protein [Streptomyces sp. ScaeMP-e10]
MSDAARLRRSTSRTRHVSGTARLGRSTSLKHPAAAAAAETRMAGGRLAHVDGRVVVTSSGVSGLDTDRQARMLSFAPARP